MRMNYKTYPTDYVQQLNQDRGIKGRKKSRAFMEYWNDMEHGLHNSESFYAKSWDISRSTAHDWVKEYTIEIELFLSHWDIKNKQHYSSVKNATEQNEQSKTSKTSNDISHNIGNIDTLTEQNEQSQPREVFNINTNNKAPKEFWHESKEFNDLYFVYSMNTKYKGKKDEAYEVFKTVEIDVNLLKLATMKYLHDPETEGRRYNLTNFLKNQIYISYLPKRMKLILDGVVRVGKYYDDKKLFVSDAGDFKGQLSAKRLIELYEAGN